MAYWLLVAVAAFLLLWGATRYWAEFGFYRERAWFNYRLARFRAGLPPDPEADPCPLGPIPPPGAP